MKCLVCFFSHAVMFDAFAGTIKPTAERAEQVCAIMEVPIHDEKAENKSLEKWFHVRNIGRNHPFLKQLKDSNQKAIYTP